jgi:hypothetical protein
LFVNNYSRRCAQIGSTRVALHAGIPFARDRDNAHERGRAAKARGSRGGLRIGAIPSPATASTQPAIEWRDRIVKTTVVAPMASPRVSTTTVLNSGARLMLRAA